MLAVGVHLGWIGSEIPFPDSIQKKFGTTFTTPKHHIYHGTLATVGLAKNIEILL